MEVFLAIIIPTAILFAIALVFGTLLAVLGKYLAVQTDERVEKITKNLSGANCGGCGYPGCAGFATALVKGEAKVEQCSATAADKKQIIAEILGVEASDTVPTKVVVCCCGGNDSLDKYDYMGYGDCRSMELLAGGRKVCPWGCLGMGACTDACHNHACDVQDCGHAVIDHEKCTKCGACVQMCPKHIIKRIPATASVYVACSGHDKGKDVREICKHGCLACGMCVRTCEAGAISMVENLPVIDYSKCTGCGKCSEKCPVKCIKRI